MIIYIARCCIALFLGTGLVLGTASALSMGITALLLLIGACVALAALDLYLDPIAMLLVWGRAPPLPSTLTACSLLGRWRSCSPSS